MATATKTIKISGTWEVQNASQQSETKKVINDGSTVVSEVTTTSPMVVAGSTVNAPLPMGGVSLAKRIFIRTDQEVTLKIGQSTDTGFKFGPGDGMFPSTSGIVGVWVTTGPNETSIEAVITGD